MISKLNKIKELKKIVDLMRPISEEEIKRYMEDAAIYNTHNSTAIEGNTLTLNETWAVLKEGATISGKSLYEHLEIKGHREAFDFVCKIVTDNIPITDILIKQIHSLVLLDKDPKYRGVYRNVSVRVGSHVPPQPYLIFKEMETYFADYNESSLPPLEKEALFHLKFETIHPFIDGNGRTGRLLLNLGLMKSGFMLVNISEKDRERYYKCFEDYKSSKSHAMMYELLLDKEIESMQNWITTFGYYIDK